MTAVITVIITEPGTSPRSGYTRSHDHADLQSGGDAAHGARHGGHGAASWRLAPPDPRQGHARAARLATLRVFPPVELFDGNGRAVYQYRANIEVHDLSELLDRTAVV